MRFIILVMVFVCFSAIPCARARNHNFYPPNQSTTGSNYPQSPGGWSGQRSVSGPSSPTAVKKATVWEAPTNDELKYKSELEASQLQNGLTHPQTMKAMWQLGQYYMNAQKYSEASQTLADLKDVAVKNKSNCSLPMDKVNLAYNKAQTEMRKEQTTTISHGPSYGQSGGSFGGPPYGRSPYGHRHHSHRHYQP
jgi:hypothetical protein